jgi:hypothetical protein
LVCDLLRYLIFTNKLSFSNRSLLM